MELRPEHLETDPTAVLDADDAGDAVADALADGDAAAAREAFVATVREGPPRTNPGTDLIGLRQQWYDEDPGHARTTDPDRAVEKYHDGVYGIGHQFEDRIDWFYNPTVESEAYDYTGEWQWQLNRHYQWVGLADAYEETGDPAYARAFEEELRGWLEQCPRPEDSGNYHPSAWRTIEAGIRTGWVWPYAFETFRRSEDVSDEALWLWACSFRDHGLHLLHHVMTQNWKTMEANGLTHVGAMFPELDGSRTFLSTGVDRTVAELERQFYPDGLQTELAPGYAGVSIGNTYSALEVARVRGTGRDRRPALDVTVPRRSYERFATIGEGYARLAAPDGTCPPLHDSGTADAAPFFEAFCEGAPPYERDESGLLPWGGYGVLRNEGRYAMLDAGPYGTGHQHQDTLQVVGHAGGEWLLVDPGSPQYTDAEETRHIRSAAGHNLVLLDGRRHRVRPAIRKADELLPTALAEDGPLAATAARRSFESEAGTLFDHERLLCDVAGVGWVVFDRLAPRDGAEHGFEWLWQSPGDWTVDDDGATAEHASGPALRVETRSTRDWTASTAAASTDPYRGWQPVGEDGDPGPLATLRVESEAATGPVETVTLLSPAGASLRDVALGGTGRTVAIDGTGGDGAATLTPTVGDDGTVSRVALDAPAGAVDLDLGEHSFLADGTDEGR